MKNAANNGSDKISHTRFTCGDEELASVIIEFSVWRKAGRGDLFNCPDVTHGRLRTRPLCLFFSEPQSSIKTLLLFLYLSKKKKTATNHKISS